MYEKRDEFDVLIESIVTTYYDDIKFNTLNEAEKMKFADQLVTKLFKDIKKKTLKIDDKEIAKTKGDFTKHSSYKTIGKALKFLEESANQNQHTELANRVKVLKETHQLLASNKDIFKNAFEYGNDILIVSYCNICVGLIVATSECISLNTKLINAKTLGGKIAGDRSFGGTSNFIDGLKDANALMRSNKLRMINDKIVVKNENFIKDAMSVMSTGKKITYGAGIGVAGIMLLLAAIKRLCFSFYYRRIKLADYARNTAEFVQMKSEGLTDNNVKAKQQKWVDRLEKLRDKISIDQEMASSRAREELEEDNDNNGINDKKIPNDDLGLL